VLTGLLTRRLVCWPGWLWFVMVFPFVRTSEQRIRVRVVPIGKWQSALSPLCDGQPETFWFAFPHLLFALFYFISNCAELNGDWAGGSPAGETGTRHEPDELAAIGSPG
jgi:hypothetical protein